MSRGKTDRTYLYYTDAKILEAAHSCLRKDQRFMSASRLLTDPPEERGLPSSLGRHAAH